MTSTAHQLKWQVLRGRVMCDTPAVRQLPNTLVTGERVAESQLDEALAAHRTIGQSYPRTLRPRLPLCMSSAEFIAAHVWSQLATDLPE